MTTEFIDTLESDAIPRLTLEIAGDIASLSRSQLHEAIQTCKDGRVDYSLRSDIRTTLRLMQKLLQTLEGI